MQRVGFVIRKATKTAKKLPPSSEEITESYDIFDGGGEQHPSTDVQMVSVTDWTMTTRGSKQLSVTGLGDKSFSAINVHFEIGLDLYG